MKRLFSLTRALVARKRKIFALFFALAASIGMMNAKVTWNRCNISDLDVHGTNASYSKEGVTLSANADHIFAMWQGYGDESHDGISFMTTDETGGFTFSNTLGKNFTKIEMFPNGPGIWDMANLGSGWSFSWDPSENKPVTVTWTGNASTVDLVKDVSDFHGENVKKIVFYFEGDSEEPDPTYTVALKDGTANADKVTLSATSVEECTTVTVTPNEECDITAFKATYNTTEELSTSFNTETGAYSFTMPAANVTIEATIALKPVPEGDVFAGFTATAGSGGFDNEGHANLVDNKFTSADWTKWCADNSYKSVPTGETGDACWWIDFEASAALNPTGYILTTGNDTGNEHGRNPKNWLLKAKLNADDAWTTIATVTNDVTMKNQSFKDYKFYVDQSGSYKYFRFEVFANQGANVMQLCQLRLIGTEAAGGGSTPTVTWNSSNVSDLDVQGTSKSYSKEGVTLSANGDDINAKWYDMGDESLIGIAFNAIRTGGYTFSNTLGKNFTKIEIFPYSYHGWDNANLGSGWSISGVYDSPFTVTWTGNASTVDMAKDESTFTGAEFVKSIVFYFEGGSEPAPANSCGDGLTWELNNGELVISYDGEGTGVMNDYDIPHDNPAPWYANREDITSVSLPEGIKTIGKDAFRDCVNLTTVTIPNSVTTIGESAFVTVEHLETVTIGTGITSIVNGAFYGNAELTTVTCSATTPPSIGEMVFGSCTNLTHIYVPAESVDAYKTAWLAYASLISAAGGGDAPDGALSGAFTINANGDKIVFSKGNLQATTTDLGTNWTWDFAPNQWSLIGNAVANNAIKGNKNVSANGTVDLFGWSTAATYYGINESWKNDDYAGDFVDWGALMGTEWRTLSRAEWLYIVSNRTDAYKKRGQATVNGVPGYVLLPDAWTLPSGLSFTNNVDNYTTNQYDGADWTAMESAGAVFLPAAGVREGTDIYQVNLYGWYWASTPNETDGGKAYYLYFDKSSEGVTEYNRWKSKSVRLVTEAPIPPYEAAIKLISAIGEVAYTAECKAKIDAARTAYDALSDGDKDLVTNIATLTDAEAAYAQLLAQAVKAVKDQIDALPATPLTDATKKLSEYNKVTAAREAYDALSAADKTAVDNYDKLTAAEAAFAAIGGGGGVPTVVVIYKSEFTSTGVTKEGVNLALSNGSMTADDMLAMDGSFEFSTSLGKFTNITIETDVNIMNISEGAYTSAGWPTGTNLGTSAAWTGNSESVLIDCMVAGNAITITCTVAPASVIADAQAAKDLIDAIPSPVVYTPECKEAIKAAREALDALSDEAKALFNEADTAALPAAETAYAGLLAEKVAPVIAAIDAVPATPLTDATKKLSEYNKVTDSRALYDALSDEEKAAVTNYDKLTAAEAAFAAISGGTPAGALSGAFTINEEGDRILFSKGNLQATTTDNGTTWTWSFAANQWNTIGNAVANTAISGNGTVSENGTVDLFGWSTTTNYYGINNSMDEYDYSGDFVDWGATMGAGWRTLTSDEWKHLLSNRTMQSSAIRYVNSTVNNIKGLIILPDDWDESYYTLTSGYFGENIISAADWTDKLEAHGAVFLPVTGYRSGTDCLLDEGGYYSTPTLSTSYSGYTENMNFDGSSWTTSGDMSVSDGLAVRLVTENAPVSPLADAQAVKDLIDAIGEVSYPDSKEAIKAAREALDALSDEAKALFATADTAALPAAEATYAGLLAEKVAPVIAAIDAIPSPIEDNLKLSVYDKVTDARALYDALATDEEKAAVTNYAKLEAAEAAFAAIGGGGEAPAGAVSGKFTIDESSVVYFSKGNLQATTADLGANWTWSFAANQWDYIGNVAANNAISGNGTVSENGSVDLFGWSTSSTKYGIHNGRNGNISDYAGDFADWGATMGDGWFTLSKEQWEYLLNTRTGDKAATVNSVADCRYTKATINTDGTAVKGIILFPDGGTFAASEFTEVGSPNTENANYTTTCTTAQWNALQAKGCVFLPAAGRRYGADVSTEDPNGYYWSSSPKPSTDDAYFVFFYPYNVVPASNDFRCLGLSVRLVTEAPASPLADAQAAKDLIDAIPQPVVYTPECKEAIKAAREALDALGDEAKALFAEADTAALPAAEATYAGLLAEKVAPVITAINAVPATPLTPENTKLSEYNKVTDARALYDALATDEEKAAVTNYGKLTAAEAAFAAIGGGGGVPTVVVIYKSEFTSTGVTKEGVNLALSNGSMTADDMLAMDGSFEFSTSLGKFTNITIETDVNIMNISESAFTSAGWPTGTNLGTSAAWTGNSESVLIDCMVAGNAITITCTVAPASVIADAIAARDLINAIPDPVTLDEACVKAIKDAREAVTALGENASLLDDADIEKLEKAEADFADLIKDATAVVAKIDAIGDVTFSAECKEKIVDAREAYDALDDELKPYVTNLTKLTDAEAAYEAARPFAPVTTVPAAVEALQYTGAAQALITAGAVEHGTILYSLDGVDYSAELPTALLPGAYTVYYKVQATDDYKDVAPTTFIATIAYNYPATYGLFGIPEGWSVKVNGTEATIENGAIRNIAKDDKFDVLPTKPEDVKLVEVVPYILDLATATDSVIYLMNGDSITGTANGNISIVIVPDAKVYFKDVNLTNTGSHPAVLCGGNAEMVVVGENSITCTKEGEYGIRTAGAGTTLTISGDKAQLSATIDPNGGTVNQ